MKIVSIEPLGVAPEYVEQLAEPLRAKGHAFVSYEDLAADEAEQLARCKDADVIIMANHPLSGEVISQCRNLKFISVAFVGIDHIGKDACERQGIHISNAAGYCDDAVAELAVGLTLDCLRNISTCNEVIRQGGTKDGLLGHELHGKTVGIVGTGRIGCRTAEIFKAFGCKLLGYSRSEREEAKTLGVTYVPLQTLLQEADIVSLHTPLTGETKHLIGAAQLAQMKPTAILINTSRGPVVDNQALAEALTAGKLAAAGLDVFDNEPPLAESETLLSAPHTVLTPHVAFAAKEAIARRAKIVFDNISVWLDGGMQNQML